MYDITTHEPAMLAGSIDMVVLAAHISKSDRYEAKALYNVSTTICDIKWNPMKKKFDRKIAMRTIWALVY